VAPPSAVVVEDAVAGVQAGRRGGFGCVVGVDRKGQNPDLKDHGADRVVGDLAEIDFAGLPLKRSSMQLPSALEHMKTIAGGRESQKVALFLDYDGTLSPIVERPEQADLAPGMRATLKSIAQRCTVAVVSGRGLEDVRARVGLENLFYAGSHGFEIDGPGQERIRNEKGADALPALDKAEKMLQDRLADIEGAQVERKKYSVAVHYRRVADRQAGAVEDVVNEVLKHLSGLRKGHGKKVFELQPDIDWDKGRAVSWLMERLGLDTGGVQPIYIGDDVTDEDAFRLLQGYGTGIIVHGRQARLTYADYGLTDTEDVQRFLQQLTEELDGGA
jgi:trehalose-phosphatase